MQMENCHAPIHEVPRALETLHEGFAEVDQNSRLESVAVWSEMSSSFVSGDGLVDIKKVSRSFEVVPEGAAEIVQNCGLVGTAIQSQMCSSLVKGDGLVDVRKIS